MAHSTAKRVVTIMIDIKEIFKYKSPDVNKLLANNFTQDKNLFRRSIPILENQFYMDISITEEGQISFQVHETDSDEEYALVHVPSAEGEFVGRVRAACEEALTDIAKECFITNAVKSEQTRRIIAYITTELGAVTEYPWKIYPEYAVFRVLNRTKWFAVIMRVDCAKMGIEDSGELDIINLKANPVDIEQRLAEGVAYPAYHMNKKHWYTLVLDGRLTDDVIQEFISDSYHIVSKNE